MDVENNCMYLRLLIDLYSFSLTYMYCYSILLFACCLFRENPLKGFFFFKLGWLWWHTILIPAFRSRSLWVPGHPVRLCLKNYFIHLCTCMSRHASVWYSRETQRTTSGISSFPSLWRYWAANHRAANHKSWGFVTQHLYMFSHHTGLRESLGLKC